MHYISTDCGICLAGWLLSYWMFIIAVCPLTYWNFLLEDFDCGHESIGVPPPYISKAELNRWQVEELTTYLANLPLHYMKGD